MNRDESWKKRDPWRSMREDRPLDSLLPQLDPTQPVRRGGDGSPLGTRMPVIHPVLLEVELEDGKRVISTACWRRAPDADRLFDELRALIEAALLQELSRPAAWGGGAAQRLHGVDLFAFDEMGEPEREALRDLGFESVEGGYDPSRHGARMERLRMEAIHEGFHPPVVPHSVWHAPIEAGPLADHVGGVHGELVDRMGATIWGEQPGIPSHVMAGLLENRFSLHIKPEVESLHELDMVLIDRTPRRWRWMPSMLFQGLCDFVGVIAVSQGHYLSVRWGACESDGYGSHLPPVLRLEGRSGSRDIAIGHELLRLAISPLREGDDPTWLKARAEALIA